LDHDEVMAIAFGVPQEQILEMHGVDAGPVLVGFFDGRDRRMLVADE
jgi:hypothetical protein